MPITHLRHAIQKCDEQKDLTRTETAEAFDEIFSGKASDDETGGFLLALRRKGETLDELVGAALSMRSHAISVEAPRGTIDIVGTGGDQHGTFNISTAVALTVAACGVPVAKHGNRASSSLSGSSDVLTALGINLAADFSVLEKCLSDANCCFLHAPRHHPAMAHVADVRRRLKGRTIFNLLGPLTNPANVKNHLIGVFDLEWLGPMAEALKMLGSEAAWLAHGHDGMDEITTTDATDVVELNRGRIGHFTLEPEQVGLPKVALADLKGGDAAHNAWAIETYLKGDKSAYRDIILFNASAALIVSGKTTELRKGLALASEAVDSGAGLRVLETLRRLTSHA